MVVVNRSGHTDNGLVLQTYRLFVPFPRRHYLDAVIPHHWEQCFLGPTQQSHSVGSCLLRCQNLAWIRVLRLLDRPEDSFIPGGIDNTAIDDARFQTKAGWHLLV